MNWAVSIIVTGAAVACSVLAAARVLPAKAFHSGVAEPAVSVFEYQQAPWTHCRIRVHRR